MSLQNICGKLDINRTLQRSLGNQRDFFSSAENLCLIIKRIHIFTLRIGNMGENVNLLRKVDFTLQVLNLKCHVLNKFLGSFYGPTQVKCRLLISSIFWICLKLCYSISKKCRKFIASKMLEIKSRHLT